MERLRRTEHGKPAADGLRPRRAAGCRFPRWLTLLTILAFLWLAVASGSSASPKQPDQYEPTATFTQTPAGYIPTATFTPTPGYIPTATFTPILAPPDMVVSKTDAGTPTYPGDPITYTITFTNAGSQTATGVVLTETVPANTVFAGPVGWTCTPPSGIAGSICFYNVGAMAGGGLAQTVQFIVTIDPALPPTVCTITNTVSVSDDGTHGADPTPLNNTYEYITHLSSCAPTKTPAVTGTATAISQPTNSPTATPIFTPTATPTATPTRYIIWLPIVAEEWLPPTATPSPTLTPTQPPSISPTPTRTGPRIVDPIAAPDGLARPKAVVVDRQQGLLWVVSRDTNEVLALSLTTLATIDRVTVGRQPFGAALLNGVLYVANFLDGSVSLIDTATRMRLGPDIHVGPEPTWVDVDPVKGYTYVVLHGLSGVSKLNTGGVAKTIGAGHGAFAIAIDVTARRGYVTNRDDKNVTVIDLDTDSPIRNVDQGGVPFGVAVNDNSGELYVLNSASWRECPADHIAEWGRLGNWVADIVVGDSCDGGWIDVNPVNGRIYIAATAVDQIWVLNADRTVRGILGPADGVGDQPFGLAVDPVTSLIYFGNKGDNTIRVITDP